MKRKLFSAILFGALLTASTSGLTSCKDYDDDISNLQSQIDKLATADQLSAKVSEMQAAISAAQSAAESKAAAAQTVADAAKAAAADAAAAASKAQSTADGATQAAKDAAAAAAAADEVAKAAKAAVDKLAAEGHATKAELEEAAKAAQAYVDSVKKAIEETHAADKAAIEKAINDGLDAVKAEIAKTNEELAALAKRLDAVETKLAALEAGEGQEEALKAIQEEVEAVADALEAIIGEYTSMVTAVDLYTSNELTWPNADHTLKFVYVDQEKDTKFPAAEGVADEQITFSSANKNVMTTDKLLVRVSPTNAVLNAANISLLNSQGADLSDYVEVKAVKPYEKLILSSTTRAAAEGNGLWEVEFKVKDGVDAAKFADAVSVKKGLTTYGIKYAVAVQNTESEETRRVISAYDVEVQPEEYEPARTSVNVTNRDGLWYDIKWIRNRYQWNNDNKPGNIVAESTTENDEASELAWVNEPDVAGGSAATVQDKNDSRNKDNYGWNGTSYSNYKPIDVEVGGTININVGSVIESGEPTASNPWNATSSVVKGFYVTLDSDNAIESAPSEINAWESYSYTNVGVPGDSKRPAKMFYGNEGSISIDSPAALGDIIGFRVYVVNLDGTLVDPDGRAFYVSVATEKVVTKVSADEVVAAIQPGDPAKNEYKYAFDGNNYYGVAAVSDAAKAALKKAANLGNLKWTITKNASAYGNNSVNPEYTRDYTVSFNNNKDKVTVTIKRPWMFLDEGSYTAQATLKNENGTEICDLSVEFKKTMPTAAPVLAWNSIYDPAKQVFANAAPTDPDIYKLPDTGISNPQAVEIDDVMEFLWYGYKGGKTYSWYTLEFANAAQNANTGKWTENLQVPAKAPEVTGPENVSEATGTSTVGVRESAAAVSSYTLQPNVKVIDGKSHEIAYKYNFGWISMTYDYQTGMYIMKDWVKYAEKNLAMTFASWIHYEQIALTSAKTFTYSPGNADNANYEVGTLYIEGKEAGKPKPVVNWSVSGDVVVVLGGTGNIFWKKAADGYYQFNKTTGYFIHSGAEDSRLTGRDFTNNSPSDETIKRYGVKMTEMSTGNFYATETGGSGDTAYEYIIEVGTGAKYYKKVANGDYYRVAYVTGDNAWKFSDKDEVVYNNQTEASVIEKGNVPSADTKMADNAKRYAIYVYANGEKPGAAGVASDFVAWNTVISNYQEGEPVFGNAGTKVPFDKLVGKYLKVTNAETGANDPFKATLSTDKKTIVLTQKTGTLNPSNKGTLTITFVDCFGIEQSRTVEYNIAQ